MRLFSRNAATPLESQIISIAPMKMDVAMTKNTSVRAMALRMLSNETMIAWKVKTPSLACVPVRAATPEISVGFVD